MGQKVSILVSLRVKNPLIPKVKGMRGCMEKKLKRQKGQSSRLKIEESQFAGLRSTIAFGKQKDLSRVSRPRKMIQELRK